MSCKHLEVGRPIQVIGLDNQSATIVTADCTLKKMGQARMVEIYDWHKETGIEKGDISTNCPLYPGGDFSSCKWFVKP